MSPLLVQCFQSRLKNTTITLLGVFPQGNVPSRCLISDVPGLVCLSVTEDWTVSPILGETVQSSRKQEEKQDKTRTYQTIWGEGGFKELPLNSDVYKHNIMCQ